MILFCPRCGAELAQRLKGEWFETAVLCAECGVTLNQPPLMLARGGAEDEVEYSLAAWAPPERSAATAALVEVDIPYRWEPELILVVPVVAEDEVDVLLEELEAPDGELGDDEVEVDGEEDDRALDADEDDDADDADGGEEAHAAMADLFVVADRLQHAPGDADLGAALVGLSDAVGASAPPYGIARPVWRRIQNLASAVAGDLEDGTDEAEVAVDARSLRDFLRDLV